MVENHKMEEINNYVKITAMPNNMVCLWTYAFCEDFTVHVERLVPNLQRLFEKYGFENIALVQNSTADIMAWGRIIYELRTLEFPRVRLNGLVHHTILKMVVSLNCDFVDFDPRVEINTKSVIELVFQHKTPYLIGRNIYFYGYINRNKEHMLAFWAFVQANWKVKMGLVLKRSSWLPKDMMWMLRGFLFPQLFLI
jgi:hypothetical protein